MNKQKNMSLLLTMLATISGIFFCLGEPNCKKLKKEYCPIVTPVCPCCDVDNPGKNCFVVTDDGDDENEPTLRAAIVAANASDATVCKPFAIVFNLAGGTGLETRSCASSKPTVYTAREDDVRTIELQDPLPEITKPICINGFTQSGADEERRIITIQIDGNVVNADGLVLQPSSAGSTIKGISIGNFGGPGTLTAGASTASIRVLSSRTRISGNNIGVLADGVSIFSSKANGINIDAGTCITIGGLNPQDKNVISGNVVGIDLNTYGVTVAGNFVGTDITGIKAVLNDNIPINVTGDNNFIGCHKGSGRNVVVGAQSPSEEDIISDIKILGNSNCITNCFIGTNSNGTQRLSESNRGIELFGVSNNTIRKCLISGYEGSQSTIGGGIYGESSSLNTISGCFIGTDITGNSALGGDSNAPGVFFKDSQRNVIKCCLISVSDGIGVALQRSSDNKVKNNLIGTNAKGTCPIAGRQNIGVFLCSESCSNGSLCFVNTTASNRKHRQTLECCTSFFSSNDAVKNIIECNLISGNAGAGIGLLGARRNVIKDNKIGTDKGGVCSIPNGYGIAFSNGSQSNTVECNLIAGNSFNGIFSDTVGKDPSDVRKRKLTRQEEAFIPIQNTYRRNAIFCNGESGILLLNGSNQSLARPVLDTAILHPDGTATITGEIVNTAFPDNPFMIEVYGNTCYRNGISEGAVFLGCVVVPAGETMFEITVTIPEKKTICCVSATATLVSSDCPECPSLEDTSEFACPIDLMCSIE